MFHFPLCPEPKSRPFCWWFRNLVHQLTWRSSHFDGYYIYIHIRLDWISGFLNHQQDFPHTNRCLPVCHVFSTFQPESHCHLHRTWHVRKTIQQEANCQMPQREKASVPGHLFFCLNMRQDPPKKTPTTKKTQNRSLNVAPFWDASPPFRDLPNSSFYPCFLQIQRHFLLQLFKGSIFFEATQLLFGFEKNHDLRIWKYEYAKKNTSHHPKSVSRKQQNTSYQWYYPSNTGLRAQLPLAAVVAVSASGTSSWHRWNQSPGFVQFFKGYLSYLSNFKRQTKLPQQL